MIFPFFLHLYYLLSLAGQWVISILLERIHQYVRNSLIKFYWQIKPNT